MKLLIIPDIHLKPWIFDLADELILKYKLDGAVFIGDLVDDWNKENDIELFRQTIERAIRFKQEHENTFWCYGNHEAGYLTKEGCAGNSRNYNIEISHLLHMYESIVEPQIVVVIDNVIFSHAGVTEEEATDDKDIEKKYNSSGSLIRNMIDSGSPLWLRPDLWVNFYNKTQVVGHTPVKGIKQASIKSEDWNHINPFQTRLKDADTTDQNTKVWFVDTFSTCPDGSEFGNHSFMSIDTITTEVTIYE